MTEKETEALLVENQCLHSCNEMLLESCPGIILLFDNSGGLHLCTQVFLTATETLDFDYIRGRHYNELLSQYFSANGMEEFKSAVNRAIASGEITVFDTWADFPQCGQARYYSVELRRAKIDREEDGSGGAAGILAVINDITDSTNEKNSATVADRVRSDFLAAMSHEIRTPMNAIIGMSDMLDRTDLSSVQKKYVGDIRRSSDALLSIINDMLDFTMLESGKMELVYDNYNLKLLLDNLYSKFSILCQDKDLDMKYMISGNLPEMVFGDENRLRQVLTNLLSNAVKYTKMGSLTLSAWMDEENILRFEIRDTGIGIREEDIAGLFNPYAQLDVRKNKSMIGAGLGLAICYNLCKLMGGDLKPESIYDEGSVFSVSLPFMQSDNAGKTDIDEIYDFSARDARVLVVDDIDINLEVAMAMLGAFDIVPVLVTGGSQALEMAMKDNYDIIFMDHIMPEMDGIEATKRIRELGGWNEQVPIIALTANAIDGMDKVFLENGMNDFLFKPLNISSLNICLKKWLPAAKISGGK